MPLFCSLGLPMGHGIDVCLFLYLWHSSMAKNDHPPPFSPFPIRTMPCAMRFCSFSPLIVNKLIRLFSFLNSSYQTNKPLCHPPIQKDIVLSPISSPPHQPITVTAAKYLAILAACPIPFSTKYWDCPLMSFLPEGGSTISKKHESATKAVNLPHPPSSSSSPSLMLFLTFKCWCSPKKRGWN